MGYQRDQRQIPDRSAVVRTGSRMESEEVDRRCLAGVCHQSHWWSEHLAESEMGIGREEGRKSRLHHTHTFLTGGCGVMRSRVGAQLMNMCVRLT